MPLADRADNVLARLLAEPRLETGNIVFVVHSLGGLVVEQLLRSALRDSASKPKAEDLLSRVRRVAFLGTPHRGALLANILKTLSLVVRPSAAVRDLPLGDPQLRDLNRWYRKFSQERGIENLILAEGRPEKVFGFSLPETLGTIVSQSSADAGLTDLPVSVDESHMTICKPSSKDAEVYVHVREFVGRPFVEPPRATSIVEAIEKSSTRLEELTTQSQQQNEAIRDLTDKVIQGRLGSFVDRTVIDAEVVRQLERLRKSRLFSGFNGADESRKFAESLTTGGLTQANDRVKAEALAWSARLLSTTHPDEATEILDSIVDPDPELCGVARALVAQGRGHLADSLRQLADINTPLGRGTAFICVLRASGFSEALDWLENASLTVGDLDSDAKFFCIGSALDSASWTTASDAASSVTEAEFIRTPALLMVVADAHLVQAVPNELRRQWRHLLMDAADFPLRSEPENVAHRRTAAMLYGRLQAAAKELGFPIAARHAADRALWLRLRDPETFAEARIELASSIRDPMVLLRRLNLALQFGVELDLQRVEREVDRQTALTGGSSPDAAAARFALAFAQNGYAATAGYIDKHRRQLLEHIDWKSLFKFEIEALAKSSQAVEAEARLDEAIQRGISIEEADWLRSILLEISQGDPIAGRLDSYRRTKSLVDLRLLVGAYEDAKNWSMISEYGCQLLELTGDIADAHRYLIAQYNQEQLDEVLTIFATYPALLIRYEKLHLIKAQTLYELGHLERAKSELDQLPETVQSQSSRQLQVNLAISSGDWESLQGFVEHEWEKRADRTALELLRSGQLAQLIGAARGREFVREAALRAHGDPAILVSCYHAAVAGGWEVSEQAGLWFQRAADSSSQADGGPVQTMSLEDLMERQPIWEEHEKETWKLVAKGEVPLFTAGQALNRSLLSLFLLPAIRSSGEPDVRKRPVVHAFSGARGTCSADPQVLAMDPTALVTAQLLNVLDLCLSTFAAVVIPHGTLGWLFQERAKISFHQPSRVAAARELRRLIAQGHLQTFDGGSIAPQSLAAEVGEPLAGLLATASAASRNETGQEIVVRGGPISKVGAFMREEADISAYEPILCSTMGLVERLAQKGLLMAKELEDARTALSLRERPWPYEPIISDGAVVYLDGISVSHLAYLGLLHRLHQADITAMVSRNEVEEADALIAHDAKSVEILSLVDQLRDRVRGGIEEGKIRLGRAVRVIDDLDGPETLMAHPSVAVIKLVDEADAAVCDDRFLNQHSFVGPKPLLTTLDVLDILHRRGALSNQRRQEARTTLRRANYSLVPLDQSELLSLLASAPITDEKLSETGELRAVRESLLRVRMGDILQIPKEVNWLNGVIASVLQALKDQWKPGLVEAQAAARSDWLLDIGDVRSWTHLLNEDTDQLAKRYRAWIGLLMTLPVIQPAEVKAAYWRWLTSRVLEPMSEEDPESYAFLIERAKSLVSQVVESATELSAKNNE